MSITDDPEVQFQIDRAAAPLSAADRISFLEHVHARLLERPRLEPGGELHRLLAEAQRQFLAGRPADSSRGPRGKYAGPVAVRRGGFAGAYNRPWAPGSPTPLPGR